MIALVLTAVVSAIVGCLLGVVFGVQHARSKDDALRAIARNALREAQDAAASAAAEVNNLRKAITGWRDQKARDDQEYNELRAWSDDAVAELAVREEKIADLQHKLAQSDALARDMANRASANAAVPAEVVADPLLYLQSTWAHPMPVGTGFTTEIQRELVQHALDVADAKALEPPR
jgi:hypothetical protein